MWILSILSDAMIHAIFGLGIFGIIAGFVLGFIPVIKPYKLAIQICSILTLTLGDMGTQGQRHGSKSSRR
jgi:hypothetical protein